MRVLIATVTAGGGHLAAAAALEEAWRRLRPNDVLEKVDVLDFASKFYRKIYVETYVKVIEHVPELYAMMFKKTDNDEEVQKADSFRRSFAHHTNKGFVKYIKQFQPDIVLCPHYLPLEIIGHDDKKALPKPFMVSIVTDFEAHAFWLEPAVNFYCVAADETRGSLVARGVPAEQVAVTGIPISGRFSEKLDLLDIRRTYGLRDDMPTLLVLAGGFGMGPVGEILEQLDKVKGHFHTLVVAGRNQELREELCLKERKHPTQVIGYSKNMHELMAVSDLIVTKPGGLTSSEALAMGKPILIINPIPGQEAANSDFLLEHGAATKVNRVEDIPFRLHQMLEKEKLAEMGSAARALGRPDAALDICRSVVSQFEQKTLPKVLEDARGSELEIPYLRSKMRAVL
ncbi:MAG: glycosyltransferase [Verrucomicrobia bacterium]|nr:glycosyltransferase [Verrucomicrobiota bacterium]